MDTRSFSISDFLRYLFPSMASATFFVGLMHLSGNPIIDTTFVSNVGVGRATLIVLALAAYGYFLSTFYHLLHGSYRRIGMDYGELVSRLFQKSARINLFRINANGVAENIYRDKGGTLKKQKPLISHDLAYIIVETEHHRLYDLDTEFKESTLLKRHERMFHFLHSAGTTLVGILLSLSAWVIFILEDNARYCFHILTFAVILFVLLVQILNYYKLRRMCHIRISVQTSGLIERHLTRTFSDYNIVLGDDSGNTKNRYTRN